jgi:hypothetical protein
VEQNGRERGRTGEQQEGHMSLIGRKRRGP